ncbi:hypothetical protein B0O99DRAFT_687378 [Bisporella sp. PMI_857]|nr:hypothetical protein B0O99DRAFT_687378 [Bisporella sp. PMI_857]
MASSKAQIYSVQEWDSWKETIARLYLDEDMKFKDVIIELKQLFDVAVTEQQLKKRIKKWKLDSKNVKGDILLELARIKEKRRLRNKKTSFRVNKKLIDDRKIERYMQRNNISEGELVSMASPEQVASPAFSVFTPRSIRSPTPDTRISIESPLISNVFPSRKEFVISVVRMPSQWFTGPTNEVMGAINDELLSSANVVLIFVRPCINEGKNSWKSCVGRFMAHLSIWYCNWSADEDQKVLVELRTVTPTGYSLLPTLIQPPLKYHYIMVAIDDYSISIRTALKLALGPEFNRSRILLQDQILKHRLLTAKKVHIQSKSGLCLTTHVRERTPFRNTADLSILLSSTIYVDDWNISYEDKTIGALSSQEGSFLTEIEFEEDSSSTMDPKAPFATGQEAIWKY